jgi:hypothetical protein
VYFTLNLFTLPPKVIFVFPFLNPHIIQLGIPYPKFLNPKSPKSESFSSAKALRSFIGNEQVHCSADAYNRAPTCPGLAPNITCFQQSLKIKIVFILLINLHAL